MVKRQVTLVNQPPRAQDERSPPFAELCCKRLDGFATDSPHAQNARGGQWRISAGFSVWHFVAKTAPKGRFVTRTIS